jgi:hypothetical protein
VKTSIKNLFYVSGLMVGLLLKWSSPVTAQTWQAVTLASNLQAPNSLWFQQNNVYFTETAGRNTSFGGNIRLQVYDVVTKQRTVLEDHPVNSDAVVVGSNNVVYLTSYYGSIPGESGGVSYLAPPYTNETQLLSLAIASEDMCIDDRQDIFIIGSSDQPGAQSLYKLPFGNYVSPIVLQTGLGRTWCIAKTGSYVYFSDQSSIKRFYEGGPVVTMPLVAWSWGINKFWRKGFVTKAF